jgi:hypothetical protein
MKSHEPEKCKWPLEAWTGKETITSLESPEEAQLRILVLGISDLQNYKIVDVSCFKSLVCGDMLKKQSEAKYII